MPDNDGQYFLPQFLQTIWQDIRFSFKVSASNPKFTLVAILTLAFGIAMNCTVFSWIDSVLLHPTPESETRVDWLSSKR